MISAVESEKDYENLVEILEKSPRFAFYCATLDRKRCSPISVAAVDTEAKGMFVFDVQAFGFDERIQACFANPKIIKIMYDCRRDSDSLYFAYGTILNGVVDLQIMDYIIKHSEKPGHEIGSLLTAVEENFGCFAGKKLKCLKRKMAAAKERDYDWLEGPSRDELVEYLTEEIRWFFPLFYELTAKYKKDLPKLTAEKIAEVQFYSSMYSASCSRTSSQSQSDSDNEDPYHNHQFMPWGIFQPRPIGDIQCTGCKLSFPRKDCHNLHFDPGRPKCTVCKSVKLSLLEAKEGKTVPAYDPNLEHIQDSSICPKDSFHLTTKDGDSEADTDDSGVSLPDRVSSYTFQRNVSIPSSADVRSYSVSL